MVKLGKTLKDISKSFDLFSEPITLRLFQKKKFSTLTGSFLSIVMLSVVLFLSYAKFDSFLNRKTMYAESYDQILSNPPLISLKNRFAINLDPYSLISLNNKRYFDFFFLIERVDFYPNGTSVKTKKNFNFTYCNSSHFPMFTSEQLISFGIKNWICPDFDEEFDVMGKYYETTYQYVQIGLMKCSNSSNKLFNDSCASDDEIIDIKKKNSGKIYLSIKIINNLLNLNDFENSFLPFVDQIDFLINIKDSFIQKEVYFTKINLETDESNSFNFMRDRVSKKKVDSFVFERRIDEFTLNENTTLNNNRIYTSIYLRSGGKCINILRKYGNFQDFLQIFGSLYSIMFALFKIISQLITHDNLTQKIANSLYSFSDLAIFRKKSFDSKGESSNSINDKHNSNDKQSIFSKFQNNFFMKMKEILWSKNKKKKEEYSVKEINETIIKDMDLIQILHKMKQLENLKTILLEKDQKILLDFTAKPKFTIDTSNMTKKQIINEIGNRRISSRLSNVIFNNVIKAYDNVLKDRGNKINEKILNLVDTDLIKKLSGISRKKPSSKIQTKFT